MSALVLRPALPWTAEADADARFRRIQAASLGPVLLLALLIPLLPVFKSLPPPVETADQVVTLILPPPPRPRPPPAPPPPEGGGPAAKPQPTPAPAPPRPAPQAAAAQTAEQARARAARSGVLAASDELAALRSSPVITSIQGERQLSTGAPEGRSSEGGSALRDAGRGSGGISTSGIGQGSGSTALNEGGAGGAGAGSGGSGGGSGGGGSGRQGAYVPKRSLEDVQIVFDRNRAAFDAIYARALRQNANLQGKLTLELTIQPSGRVSSCKLVASELNDPELESRLISRVLLLDFGAEEVPTLVTPYVLRFYPS